MTKPILIAEDYADDVLLLESALRQACVTNPIHYVCNGDEATAYLSGAGDYADRGQFPRPDVLFLDLRLPRRNGFEVLQWLKNQRAFKDMLVIILTGARETRFVQHAYQLGANSFIIKPCSPSHIYTLILYFRKYWMLSEEAEAPAVEAKEALVLEPALEFSGQDRNAGRRYDFNRLAVAMA